MPGRPSPKRPSKVVPITHSPDEGMALHSSKSVRSMRPVCTMSLDAAGGDLALNAALVGATADLERATLAPA